MVEDCPDECMRIAKVQNNPQRKTPALMFDFLPETEHFGPSVKIQDHSQKDGQGQPSRLFEYKKQFLEELPILLKQRQQTMQNHILKQILEFQASELQSEQQNSQTNLSTQQELPLRLRQSQNSQTRFLDSHRRNNASVQSPKVVIGVNMGKASPQQAERGKASELKTYSEHTCPPDHLVRTSNNTPVISTDFPLSALLPPPSQLRVLTPPAESMILMNSPQSPGEKTLNTVEIKQRREKLKAIKNQANYRR